MKLDLSRFDNRWYRPGRSRVVQALWFFFGLPLLETPLLPGSGYRCRLLRWFGATIGQGVVVKPRVRVKYPWRLTVGENSWIGEECWIDNIESVTIGSNACLSQGSYLCTGNHDWTDPCFGLIAKPITIGDAAWVGARSVIGPGVELGEGSVAAAGSIVSRSLPAWEIHAGNPARFVRVRQVRSLPRLS